MTNTSNSHFKRGSGVFACKICGHNTRHTGGDGTDLKLCALCFDLAGEDNHLSDNGATYDNGDNVRAMCAALDKQSGDGTAEREFPEVCKHVVYSATKPEVTEPVKATDDQFMTIVEACKVIRASRNRTIFITVNQHASIEGDTGHVFPILGHVKVTAPVAIGFVEQAYKHFEERGARVRMVVCDTCIFVG